jgi:UPF0716 protein FxsA
MHPLTTLFLLFLIVPLVEIYLLIKVGGIIGAMPTVFLVVFTAVLGAWLLRLQGFATIARVRSTLNQGGIPAVEMLEGAVLLVAGALLLTPGFFTDTIGFLCLVPPLRRTIILRLLRHFFVTPFDPFSGQQPRGGGPGRGQSRRQEPNRHRPTTIEGEYEREDDR